MRIVIMGTGGFAVPTFERLLSSPHDIVAVVTMPLRDVRGSSTNQKLVWSHHGNQSATNGSGQTPDQFSNRCKMIPTPVRSVAAAAGLAIFDPENINDPALLPTLHSFQADLLFVCDYGKILAPHVLTATRFGGINLHGSLLPKYRGAAPINRALLNGEPTVGVSVIHITPQLDAGPVVAMSEPLPVLSTDTAVEIETQLAGIGADLVLSVLLSLENGTLTPVPQRDELATKAPKLKKQDGEIDWQRSAREIVWQYQAMQPWPKIFTMWYRQNVSESHNPEPMRLILGCVQVFSDANMDVADAVPGTILAISDEWITVATGNGLLQIREIQPVNKKMMPVNAFLRGYSLQPGDRLGK